jgi:hypothetical protein
MSLLTEVQPTPQPVLLATGSTAPPLGPSVKALVVQQSIFVAGGKVAAGQITSKNKNKFNLQNLNCL